MHVARGERDRCYRPSHALPPVCRGCSATVDTGVHARGNVQVAHVFVERDEITGVLDWSQAGHGDAMYHLAILAPGAPRTPQPRHRRIRRRRRLRGAPRLVVAAKPDGDLLAGRAGYDPCSPGCEIDGVRFQLPGFTMRPTTTTVVPPPRPIALLHAGCELPVCKPRNARSAPAVLLCRDSARTTIR